MLFAHGVGSRGDLPLPLWQFAWAAMAALVISFMALAVLWKTPRLAALTPGAEIPAVPGVSMLLGGVARIASFALFVLVLAAGLFGTDDANVNIAPFAIFVVLWVGMAIGAAILGNPWNSLSPFDTIGLVSERATPAQPAPAWSYWLAPAGAFGFLTIELVHPAGDSPRLLGIAMVIYSVVMIGAVVRWGRDWLRSGETFAALFTLLGAMAPLGRSESDDGRLGRWHVRSPLAGLSAVESPRSITALLLVVLGGTSFDGFAESEIGRDLFAADGRWARAGLLLLGLIGSIAILSALYLFATRFSAKVTVTTWGDAVADFTPSLVPIVFGYTIAHYAQLLIDETQTFVFLLSDPFGRGLNIFGGADNRINFNLISVDLIAWIQALGIVVGHIAAVIVAHDRAMERYPSRDASRSQYAMLFAMVIYSVLGLWLLLNA